MRRHCTVNAPRLFNFDDSCVQLARPNCSVPSAVYNDYIKRWKKNAEQHFNDCDYDWVASLVAKTGAQRILEVGCGVGYSTLALANRGIQALSIDPIPEAITETRKLLESFGISVGILGEGTKPGMLLKQIDVIENFQEVSLYTQWIDLVLICNPGGKLETDLTKSEI